jgi:hypothetical protein
MRLRILLNALRVTPMYDARYFIPVITNDIIIRLDLFEEI